MSLRFNETVSGIPVEIAVTQADGSEEIVTLRFDNSENSLVGLLKQKEAYQSKVEEITKKYPAFETFDIDNFEDETADNFKQYVDAITEIVAQNYDGIFGDGSFKKLNDAGLGMMKLIPLLDRLTDGIAEEMETEANQSKVQSDKLKGQRLAKNKKKQK